MTEKIQSIYIKGKRHYPVPSGATVPSVSTFLDVLPKDALQKWKLTSTAEWAVDHRTEWENLPRKAAVDVLSKGATYDNSAASNGTIAHAIVEDLANGRVPSWVPPGFENVEGYWREFVEEFQVEVLYAEPWLWNQRLHYAGSADLFVTLVLPGTTERIVACVDTKTGNGVYGSTAYQLAAYGMCDVLVLNGGRELVDPPHVTHTFVFWLRPHGWALHPMEYSDEVKGIVRGARWLFDRVYNDWGYKQKAINQYPVRTKGDPWKIEE